MRGVGASILDNYRRFIGSLDHAIADAGLALRQREDRLDASQQDWRQKQKQLASYDTLASRRAARERTREATAEQRQSDERTNNSQARQRSHAL
jgi:flagellar FliJ protein